MEEKVRRVLEVVGVKNLEQISREQALIALGRLLSVKAREREPSVHEVTKEVRKALEIVVKNPLREDPETVVARAEYTTPPFESPVLNKAYRLLLDKLLRDIASLVKDLGPMWRKRLVNLTIENIYVAATADREYRDKIFEVLGSGESQGGSR